LKEATTIQENLKMKLQMFKGYITATVDLWTDSIMLHGYVGITLHFIRGSTIAFYCIGVEEIIGSHTAMPIKDHVSKKLAMLGLTLNDVFAIATDNGANILAALRNYQGMFIINVSIMVFLDYANTLEDNSESEELEESDENTTLEIATDESFSPKFEELTGQRYSCAAHGLQLCLLHGVKATLIPTGAFKKLLKLQNSFSHSQTARSELKSLGKLYKKFCQTRWGC